ncbi:MAG: putative quorum-sensing-regulated virulence factor [Chlamydiales bacterium]
MKRPIYYDTETTGVKPQVDRIIEIAAFDPLQGRTFEMLVNPGIPIPQEATNIHGISDEMVKEAPSYAVVGREFAQFCSGEVVLIAHNNDNFDKFFLQYEGERHNVKYPQWDMVDSLKWARKYRPDLPKHSLQYLRQVYGVAENNAHRALDDVKVLHEIFAQMIDDLSMEIVLNLLEAPLEVETMPFGKHQGRPLSEIPPSYFKWLDKQGAFEKPENSDLKAALEKIGVFAHA